MPRRVFVGIAAVGTALAAWTFFGNTGDDPVPRVTLASGRSGDENWSFAVYTDRHPTNKPAEPLVDGPTICLRLQVGPYSTSNGCGFSQLLQRAKFGPSVRCGPREMFFYGIATSQVRSVTLRLGRSSRRVTTQAIPKSVWRYWIAVLQPPRAPGAASAFDASGRTITSFRPGETGACPTR
jgi:hypothetical protein